MYRILLISLALISTALSAEIKSSYANLEQKTAFQPDLKTHAVENHNVFKKEAKLDVPIHPVYRNGEVTNQGRARIEPVKPEGPVINFDKNILSDEPAVEASTEVNRIDHVQVPNYGYVPAPTHPEVAYPDIPYAPGYGYDNSYSPSNSYDVYGNGLTNYYADSEPPSSTLGVLWSQVPDSRTMLTFVGRTIVWFLNSIFVLMIGSLLTVAVCSYTNLCTIAFHGVGPIHEEMRALVTPERLEKISNAANFVKTAIDKYQKIQQVADSARLRRSVFF